MCVSSALLSPAVLWVLTTLTASRRLRKASGVVSSSAVLTVRTAGASLPSSNSSRGTNDGRRVRIFRFGFHPRRPPPKNCLHQGKRKVNAMIVTPFLVCYTWGAKTSGAQTKRRGRGDRRPVRTLLGGEDS